MRRLLTWLVVSVGIAALVRKLRRRSAAQEAPAAGAPTSDPADELRQKLAETRADEPEGDVPETPEASVEERRADVHTEARATLDEMQPDDR